MVNYFYKAKNLKGEEKSGILEAQDEKQLAKFLKKKGYFLISVKETEKKKKFEISGLSFLEKFKNISLTEKLFFTKNLEVMIRTGVALSRALGILQQQIKNKKFKKAINAISERIMKGDSFSQAFSYFPKIFSPLYQETLKIGEETGKLDQSLKILAEQMEREHNLKSKIKTAMIYPIMVLSMALIIGVLMMVVAIPKLKVAFEELNLALPFTTRAMLFLADFLTKKWPITLAIIGGLIFLIIEILKMEKGSKFKSKISLTLPLISKITKQTNSAFALRTLSSLLKAGVPVVRSLQITSGALTNFYFQESLKKAAFVVEKGEKLSHALQPYKELYSPMVLQMIEVGEETGETSTILEKLANFYENEVASSLQKLSSTIEPLLIALIGGIIGFFAISMFQPMFSIIGGIQ